MSGRGESVLIGRDTEVARVRAFLDQPARFPRALLLEGEPGIGKTSLWTSGLEASRESSIRILSCNPGPAEPQIAFGALGDLLEDMGDEALPHLPPPQRRALSIALLLEEPEGPPPDQRATFTAVLGLIRYLASTAPVVVAIDDIHFLDAASAAALAFVTRRLRAVPVGFLLSLRTGESEDFSGDVERGLGEDRFERLRLGPLSLGAVYHLLRDRLGMSYPRPTLRRIHEGSRGNPLLALEIGRALIERGGEIAVTEQLPVPTQLRELLTRRLDALPKATRAAVLPVAGLADPTLEALERAFGAGMRIDLEPAFEGHVLEWDDDRIRFTHPLLSSTIYANASLADRRAIHRRLAEVVALPEERARHLAVAAEGPDPAVAKTLETAAGSAAARGLPGEAANLMEMASLLTPPDRSQDLQQRKSAAANYHFTGGGIERSREILLELLDELSPGPARAGVLLGLAWSEDDLQVAKRYGQRAIMEGPDEHTVRTAVEHLLTFMNIATASIRRARRHAYAAVVAAEKASDPLLLAQAISAKLLADTLAGVPCDPSEVKHSLNLERQLEGIAIYYPPSLSSALRLMLVNEHDGSRTMFEQAFQRATETGDEVMQAATLFHWAELECRSEQLQRARQLFEDGYTIIQQIGFESRRAPLLYVGSLTLARLGSPDAARQLAEQGVVVGARSGMAIFELQSKGVLGSLELSLGHVDAAADHLRSLAAELRQAGLEQPSVCLALPDAIETLIAVGKLKEARDALEWVEERSETTESSWGRTIAARCRALLTAAEGDEDAALRQFEEVLALHEGLSQPYERARTLLALGTTLRRARRRRDARHALTEARGIFEEHGVRLWAERANDELARIGGRAPSRTALTPAEQRVAELVATGLSNREVAAQLVVSVHTIETQLSKVYAKLGVRSRSELTRRMVSDTPPRS